MSRTKKYLVSMSVCDALVYLQIRTVLVQH